MTIGSDIWYIKIDYALFQCSNLRILVYMYIHVHVHENALISL